MKTLLVTIALALVTLPSVAAVQYDFMQKNSTGDVVAPTTEMSARAIVEGDRSRIEFLSGNVYPPGTYVISTEGARRLFFVDPVKQWYTEVNTSGLATTLASSNIKVENLRTNTEELKDNQRIAGIDTKHSRITLEYDLTLTVKAISLRQHVKTEIDSWTTDRFGALNQGWFQDGLQTGNPELDKVLSAETSKVAGFPLRHVVTIRTAYEKVANSKLDAPSIRTITRETWVTRIGEVKAQPSMFVIPAAYRRADQPELPAQNGPQVLTFEPAGSR
jgi:hypothetical protein